MIEYYFENKKSLRELNDNLYELIEFCIDGEDNAEFIFEEYIYNKDPVKYQNIVDELIQFIKDDFLHYLSPIHQKALYNIISKSITLEKDFLRTSDMTKDDKKQCKKNIKKLELFLEAFFEDHDFETIRIYFEPRPNANYDSLFLLEIDDYLDLLPSDLVEKYNISKKHHDIYNEICKSTVDIYRGNIPIKFYAEGAYTEGLFYILNHEINIQRGDLIIYLDEINKFRKTFRINIIDEIKTSDSLPSYFVVSATLLDREFITNIPTQTFNTNIEGSNNNISVNSTIHGDMVNTENIHNIFDDMRKTFSQKVDNVKDVKIITDAVTELEKNMNNINFKDRYNKLIEVASNHMTLLQPFLLRLSEFF